MRKIVALVCILSVFIMITPSVMTVKTINSEILKKPNSLDLSEDRCDICPSSGPIKKVLCSFLFGAHAVLCVIFGRTHWTTFLFAYSLGCPWAKMIP